MNQSKLKYIEIICKFLCLNNVTYLQTIGWIKINLYNFFFISFPLFWYKQQHVPFHFVPLIYVHMKIGHWICYLGDLFIYRYTRPENSLNNSSIHHTQHSIHTKRQRATSTKILNIQTSRRWRGIRRKTKLKKKRTN